MNENNNLINKGIFYMYFFSAYYIHLMTECRYTNCIKHSKSLIFASQFG